MKQFFTKRKAIYLSIILTGIFFFSYWCNRHITENASGRIFINKKKIPFNNIGLVPGTSMYLKNNCLNPYFKYRMIAAAELFHYGKIKHILVSGDNSKKNYDEPTDMMNYLVRLGVPSNAITRDYAGFRTFDSMIRAKEIFGLNKFTIISQKSHNERALFIADHYGMDVVAYNARDPFPQKHFREYLAKVKAVLDVYLIRPQPYFLGKKEPIIITSQK